MKKIILPLFVLFTVAAYGQAGWVDQTPIADLPGLNGVFSLDGLDVWVVGNEGTILHSMDGGDSWTLIEGVTDRNIFTVEFINADTGFLGCDNDWNDSYLYKTMDGGATWENVADVLYSPFQGQEVREIDFVEVEGAGTMRGYATGGLSFAWLSDDYGETWTSINGACGMGSFESCCIVDENMGWFVGLASTMNDATVTLMTDAGGTWTPQLNPTEQPLRGVCFANDIQGVAVGLVGTIINTADGGETWVSRDNDGYRWEGVFMTGSGKAWTVGSDGDIGYSADFGNSWAMQESGVSCELWEAYFIDDDKGWVVGGGIGLPGVILHTTTGGIIAGVDDKLATLYTLEQNRPNPFFNSTTISYRIDQPAIITLTVYDLLGEEVAILVNERQLTDEYTVEFTPENPDSGIYYCQLAANGRTVATRKMVVLR